MECTTTKSLLDRHETLGALTGGEPAIEAARGPVPTKLWELPSQLKQKGVMCVASGCNNSLAQDIEYGLLGIRSYYGFPDNDEQRSLWLRVVPQADWDSNNSTICSDHFVGGRRTENPGTPGYVPILLSPKEKSKIKPVGLDNSSASSFHCLSGSSNVVTPSSSTQAATVAARRVEEPREFRITGKKIYSGQYCSAPGCKNTSGKDKQIGVKRSYHSFPLKDKKRLKLWLKAIPWDNWMPSIHQKICSEHFVGGVKSNVVGDPGYVPTLFPQLKELRKERASSRKKRIKQTSKSKKRQCRATIKRKSDTKYSASHVSTVSPYSKVRLNLNPSIVSTPRPELTLKVKAATSVAPQIKYIPFQPTSLNSNLGNNSAKKIIIVGPRQSIKQSPVVVKSSRGLTFPPQLAVPGKSSLKSHPGLITVPASTVLGTLAVNTPAQIKEQSEDDILSGFAQPKVEPEDHESEDTMSASGDDPNLSDELLLSGLAQPKMQPHELLLDDNGLAHVSEDNCPDLSNTPQIQDLAQEMVPDHISFTSANMMSEERTKMPANIGEIKLEKMEDEQRGYCCTVPGCLNNSTDDDVLNVQRDYFTYPIEDPKRLKLWLQVIDRVDWMPAWDSRICSDHFAEGQKTEGLGSKGHFPMVSLPVRMSSDSEDRSVQEGIVNFQTSTRSCETSTKTVSSRKRPLSQPNQDDAPNQKHFATVQAHTPSPVSMFSNMNATTDQSRHKTSSTFSGYSDCSTCIQGFKAMGELEIHLVLNHLKHKLPIPIQDQNQIQHTSPISIQAPIEPQTVSNEIKCKLCDMVLYHPLLMKSHLEAHDRKAASLPKTQQRSVLPPTSQASSGKQPQKMVSLITKTLANKTQSLKNVTGPTTSQVHSSAVSNPVYKVVSARGSQPNSTNASPTTVSNLQFQNLLSMLQGSIKAPDQNQPATKEGNINKQSVILIKQSPSSSAVSVTPQSALSLSSSSTSAKKPSVFMMKQSPSSSVATSLRPQSERNVSSNGASTTIPTVVMIKESPLSTVVTSVASKSALSVSTSSANSTKPPAFMLKQSSSYGTTNFVTPKSALTVLSSSDRAKNPTLFMIKESPSSSVATSIAPVTVSSERMRTKSPAVMLIKQTPSSKATLSVTTQSALNFSPESAYGKRPAVIMLKQNSSTMTTSVTQQPATTVSSKSVSTRKPGVIMIKESPSPGSTTSVTPQSSITPSSENTSMKRPVVIMIKQSPSSSLTTSLALQSTVAVAANCTSTNIPAITQTKQRTSSNMTMSVAHQSTVAIPSESTSKEKPGKIVIKQSPSSSVTASGIPQSSVTISSGSASTIKQIITMEQDSSPSASPESAVRKLVSGPKNRSLAENRLVHQKSYGTSPVFLILPPAKRRAQSICDEKSRALRKARHIQKSALDRQLADVLEAKQKQENEPIEPDQVVICHACQSFHSSSAEFEAHMRRRHRKGSKSKISCEVCMQEFLSYTNLMDHIHPLCPKARDGLLHCKPCDKSFSTPADLRGHLQNDHLEDQKWCFTCHPPVRLHSTRALSIHRSDLHRNKPTPRLRHLDNPKPVEEQKHQSKVPYQCDVCGRVLRKNKEFIRHMRTHTGEKPFSCLQCPKTFACRSSLAIHLRFHNGIRPFSCDICSKTFLVRGNLRVHEKTHHSGPSAKVEPGGQEKKAAR